MVENMSVCKQSAGECKGEQDLAPPFSRRAALRLAGTIVLGALLTGSGCGKSGARLEGAVTLDGNPIAEGKVRFYPQGSDRQPPVTAPIKDGWYTASSVPLGKVLVRISATKKTGRMIHEYSEPREEVISIIPKAYEDGIAIEVTADESTRNFALTSR